VGSPGRDAQRGDVFVFVRSRTSWNMQKKLTVTDGAGSDSLGSSAAISNDTVLAGAPYRSTSSAAQAGAAYVFVRSGTTWTLQAELAASDLAEYAYRGSSVAISGDTAVVGAMGENSSRGAAYVFVRSGNIWTQQAK